MTYTVFKAVLEIHDEVAAQIQNHDDDFEYIDGVSSICEDDLEELIKNGNPGIKLSSVKEEHEFNIDFNEDMVQDEELEEIKVDTFRVIGIRRKKGECLVS